MKEPAVLVRGCGTVCSCVAVGTVLEAQGWGPGRSLGFRASLAYLVSSRTATDAVLTTTTYQAGDLPVAFIYIYTHVHACL